MKTKLLKDVAGDWVEDVVDNGRFRPYWWIRQVTAESQRALMQQQLSEWQQDDTAVLLGVYNGNASELTGFAAMKPLDWDTSHFGINVWRLHHLDVWGDLPQRLEAACALVAAVRQEAFRHDAQTVHVWMPLDAIHLIQALEAVGFRTMESQIYWLFDLKRQLLPPKLTEVVFRSHQPTDEAALVSLARHAYTTIPNRFHSDPNLPNDLCDELYANWLHNSCSGEAADYITVIDVDDRVAGYATLRYLNDQQGLCNVRLGQLLLGAINPAYRQRGLHDDMLRSILVWLLEQKADIAFVGTQTNNAAAQMGMARNGWRPVCSGLSLHLWRS
jgi:ribosomal protein S18 acetylase RimI-like enzyme